MRWIDTKVWVALSLVGAIAVGCISEVSGTLADGSDGSKSTAARPLIEALAGDVDEGSLPSNVGPRGGNDNSNDNGSGGCDPTCPDFDGDGLVGLSDLAELLRVFGSSSGPGCIDIDGDGVVDLSDLATLLANFGAMCNANGNGNDNGNENANDNGNSNGNENGNANGNANDNGNGNGNGNANDNGNANGNSNDNENSNGNTNGNDNANGNTNGNGNSNGNSNDNANDNGNGNDNENGNDNGNGNLNDNGGDNGNGNANANGNGNDNGGGPCADGSIQVSTQMTGGDDNEARYREFPSGCRNFRVRVRDFPAFSSFTVFINGAAVGTLFTDDRGRGELEFENGGFPAGFPTIQPGDRIDVGSAFGVFDWDCSSNSNCNG